MESLPINPVDLGVLLILLVSALIAFYRGFVRETLAVAVWVGAAFVTLYAFAPLQPYARNYLSPTLLADAVTGIVIFILAMIVLTILSNMIAARVQQSQMGALDRSLGFVFGLARGLVVAAAAYLLAIWIIPPAEQPPWLGKARTLPILQYAGDFLLDMLPDAAERRSREAIGQSAEQARDAAERARALQRATGQPIFQVPAASGTDSAKESGYKTDERKALDGLIRSNRDK